LGGTRSSMYVKLNKFAMTTQEMSFIDVLSRGA